MNIRRLLLALCFAFFMSGLLTFRFSRRLEQPALASTVPVRHVLAAAKDLQSGDTLAAGDLKVVQWPASVPLVNSFEKAEPLIGRVLTESVMKDQLIQQRHLLANSTERGISTFIPEGKRAMSLRLDEVASVTGFIKPRSIVDILVTYPAGQNYDTALQDVTVLAVNGNANTPQGKPEVTGVGTVTLLVTPQQAGTLAVAIVKGRVQLVLRNGHDYAILPGNFLSSSTGLMDVERSRPKVPSPVQTSTGAKAIKSFVVETIAGGKTSVQSFEEREP